MRYCSRQTRLSTSLALLSSAVFALNGCFLFKKKKSAQPGIGLIVQAPAPFLNPARSDPESIELRFTTTKPALCELMYYAQSGEPSKANALIVPCSKDAGAVLEHTETFKTPSAEKLYFVQITAWEPSSSKDKGDRVTIRQVLKDSAGSNKAIGNTDPAQPVTELLIARFNIPRQTAEIHRHRLPQALATTAVTDRLNRTVGCRQGVPTGDEAPFREPASPLNINNLATADFASSSVSAHRDYPQILQVSYPSLNEGQEKWSLYYKDASGADASATTNAIGRILNLEMESANITAFGPPQLSEAVDPLAIDPQKPLKFSWTTSTLTAGLHPYLTVQIGRPENPKSVFCVFDAMKTRGEIDAKLLQALEPGKHVVLAELATNQYVSLTGWIFSFYDWRVGRIEK